jgi:3',5'-cyclic AMP phosphodiesterase CpdA
MRASVAIVALLLCGCSRPPRHESLPPRERPATHAVASASGDGAAPPPAASLSRVQHAPLTTEKTLRPRNRRDRREQDNPGLIAALRPMLDRGLGDLEETAGEAHRPRTFDGSKPLGESPRTLARLVHLTDVHITDDESPRRVACDDAAGSTRGAHRPQDPYTCLLLDAAVRTVNALHRASPIDALILGGDAIDNAQSNELEALLGVMRGGAPVDCDAGTDDDPVPGPGNDPKDPFGPEGLLVPWRWVTGNHDVLLQGTATLDLAGDAIAGSFSPGGTRDWKNGGEVGAGDIAVPDASRALLTRRTLLSRIARDGDGHGLTADVAGTERAFHAFDVGSEVRVVVLDTAAETGGAAGLLRQGDVDRFLRPLLDAARRDRKLVLLAGHHAIDALTRDGGSFGSRHPDALLPDQLLQLLGDYDNVVAYLAGHAHRHRVRPFRTGKTRGLWEIGTAALVDFPNQLRLIEILDHGGGRLSLRSTCVDLAESSGALALEGRRRSVVDYVAGWSGPGPGTPDDRNVELFWTRK